MDLSMDVQPQQKQTQKQEIVMTSKLQMAIELLQYNSLELEKFIDSKLLENPLLAREEEEWQERVEAHRMKRGKGQVSPGDTERFKKFVSYHPGLLEHLELQLPEVLPGKDREIARYILASLDERGLLEMSPAGLAEELDCRESRVENIRKSLLKLDPAGIAARSPLEALRAQLHQEKHAGSEQVLKLAERILEEHYEELEKLKVEQLFQKFSADPDDLKKALNLLRRLNPHPAASFDEDLSRAGNLEPDVIVKKTSGEYRIELNRGVSPALTINDSYYRMMKQAESKEAREFLEDKFQSALWIIRAVERRRMTLERISSSIVEKQREFLEKGIKYLKPMTMEEIAEEADVHESTVSRAVRDKYLQTGRGLYQFKFFFNGGVKGTAAPAVRAIISEIIEKEEPDSPMSDREIIEKIEEEYGIDISRRTAAKYRNSLNIPSSTRRGRWYHQI